MDDAIRKKLSRRNLLKGVALLAAAAALPGARAQGKASKAAMKYQDHPKGDAECSKCLQWIPGKTPTAMGTCKVVEGEISPKGWCIAYVKKP
ncbi:MAG: high-potential iron-sulfur protein [Betaproteobacteria bacterium]|jgi:anaerobic selenocysteine-containing dehydrogenase|nr:high-potential iron-sulfur protein [Betaproteobacteria bacterium]